MYDFSATIASVGDGLWGWWEGGELVDGGYKIRIS
jgi:hypothetical protein